MQDSEFSRRGQGHPSLFTTRRPLAKEVGVRSGSFATGPVKLEARRLPLMLRKRRSAIENAVCR